MLKVECLTFKGYPRILIVNVLFPIRFDPSNPQRAIRVAAKVAKDFEYKQKKYNIFCCGLKMPIQKMSIAVRQMIYECTETRIYEFAISYIRVSVCMLSSLRESYSSLLGILKPTMGRRGFMVALWATLNSANA